MSDINKNENRIDNLRRDQDAVKNISITIRDIDTAILHHLKNIIKPTYEENGIIRSIPIHFAQPQTWKSIQEQGWFRDGKSKQIMVPAIVLKNNGLAKQDSMPVDKLDGNLRKTIFQRYNNKNRYDIFSVLNNIKPNMDYYSVAMPDYVIVSYQLQIWTGFISHMNNVIEKLVYAENSYWGDKNYKFRTTYANSNNTVEVVDGERRAVRNTIDMSVYAYILPKSFNNQETTKIKLTPAKVIITAKFDHELESKLSKTSIPIKINEGISEISGLSGCYVPSGFSGLSGTSGTSGTSGIADSLWTGSLDGSISRNSKVDITGSLEVSGGITGSILGTASSASHINTSNLPESVKTIFANYTASINDKHLFVSSSSDLRMLLYPASSIQGKSLYIKLLNNILFTIYPDGSDIIEFDTFLQMENKGISVELIPSGNYWFVI